MSSFYLSQLTFCRRSRHLARNPPKKVAFLNLKKNNFATFLFIVMLCKKTSFNCLNKRFLVWSSLYLQLVRTAHSAREAVLLN
jgi:hypothetical protein